MRKIISGRRSSLSKPMKIKVQTNNSGGTGSTEFQLPLNSASPGGKDINLLVKWGDGSSNYINAANFNNSNITKHNYSSSGSYDIEIYGRVADWKFSSMPDDDSTKMKEINQWGGFIATFSSAFDGCQNLNSIDADDYPVFASNFACSRFLRNCGKMQRIVNLDNWRLGAATSCLEMFNGCAGLRNGGIGTVGGLTQPIDLTSWDVSSISNMEDMFRDCGLFNGKLFQVTSTTTVLSYMFSGCINFDNASSSSMDIWDTSNVGRMDNMFSSNGNSIFNRDISGWDTSSVTTMSRMFQTNTGGNFNQPIGQWDTSNVQNMCSMFSRQGAFDQNLSNWNVHSWNVSNLGIVGTGPIAAQGGSPAFTLSTANYNALLIAWDQYNFPNWPGLPSGYAVDFGQSQYSLISPGNSVINARNSLIAKWGAINDGGGI